MMAGGSGSGGATSAGGTLAGGTGGRAGGGIGGSSNGSGGAGGAGTGGTGGGGHGGSAAADAYPSNDGSGIDNVMGTEGGKPDSLGVDTSTDGGLAGGCQYQCLTDSSGATGWYLGTTLVCAANCTGNLVSCAHVGTRSEGCYAATSSGGTPVGCNGDVTGLIAYLTCGQ